MKKKGPGLDAREPSFTAVWFAWARNNHATVHPSPIFSGTRSVQLVPEQALERVVSAMEGFSQDAADTLILLAVVRQRVLWTDFHQRTSEACVSS